MGKNFLKDETGVNVVVEYIFTLIIMSVLLTILLMTLNSVISTSDRLVLKEEFDIISNDFAGRITCVSNEIYMNGYTDEHTNTTATGYGLYFELPKLVKGKQYIVNVTYDAATRSGDVIITYEANSGVTSAASFSSVVPVEETFFYSSDAPGHIYYNGSTIVIDLED
ncbi:hypothetical protein CUJ83_06980 [Methanocella sp. CWC-04]|uniref:Class III signal peptide n=1 Tax=Methanooceanicella nereidis TaxID=2052831 RepID=A0AAP2RD83_9EURY|nr:hypothetical protein [Methanocella sp. CWC-04]MCD1294741.1 hypothetical protein [Methanocella sp. CWC-04]